MASKRISVVLGGAGFIGSHLVELLLGKGDKVIVVDNLSTGRVGNVPPGAELVVADVKKELPIPDGVDRIFNLATSADTPYIFENPEEVFCSSFYSTCLCIEYLRKNPKTRLFFASSSEVFGLNEETLFEDSVGIFTQQETRWAYAEGKRIAELLLSVFDKNEIRNRISIGRFFDVYGEKRWRPSMITNFVVRALRGDDIIVYGDGSQVRNPTYVGDVVRAILMACEHGGTFNIASGEHYTVLEIAKMVLDVVGGKSKIAFAKKPPGDTNRRVASSEKIRQLGWRDEVKFLDGLKRTVEWWRDGQKYNLVCW